MPKVILVDDEIWTIRCLESLLADYPNYHIAGSFSDGQEALDFLRKNACDVVFTDLRMDRMSGRKLISVCVQEKIPVRMVIISAYSDFSAAREGIRNGVIDYLTKPITRKDMAALIQRLDATFLDEHTSRRLSLCQTIAGLPGVPGTLLRAYGLPLQASHQPAGGASLCRGHGPHHGGRHGIGLPVQPGGKASGDIAPSPGRHWHQPG